MRAFFVGVVLVVGVACKAYTPLPIQTVEPKTVVRVFLNDVGRQAVATQVGPNIDFLEGTVTANDSAGLTLDARLIKRLTTPEEKYGTPRHVIIPSNAIASTTVPRVSKERSLLLGGAVAAGALLVGNALSGGELFGGGGNKGGNNQK